MVAFVDVFTFFVEKAVSSQKVSVSSQKVSVFFPKSFSFYSYITGNQCVII